MTLRRQELLDPATLLTAIPAQLGFIPERSIILIAFSSDDTICATMRHDLLLTADGSPRRGLVIVLSDLGEICARYGATSVVAVIADDRYATDDQRYRRVAAIADRHLSSAGGLYAAFVVGDYAVGRPWHTIWHPAPLAGAWAPPLMMPAGIDSVGVLRDPHTSATAVREAVTTGRRILARRSEMVAMLAEAAHCEGPCQRDAADDGVRPVDAGVAIPDAAEELRFVVECVVGAGGGDLTCEQTTRLERAITSLTVRDALMALAVTDQRRRAEDLWRQLTRRSRGSARASAATLLAHLHYVEGDGAYAGVALDCALAADPEWSLATLLDRALRAGMRPSHIESIVDQSYGVADELGVTLPAATLRAAG